MAVGASFVLPKQGSRPVGRPRPAGRPATPQSRPAWAGQGAGHPAEPAGLGAGLGWPGGRAPNYDMKTSISFSSGLRFR